VLCNPELKILPEDIVALLSDEPFVMTAQKAPPPLYF
jgi:hypothetical protein